MKKLLILALLLVLPLWGQQAVQAQNYKHIGVENGLSNRRVFAIQKAGKGYMWFLTQDGIDRYDGKNIKHYYLRNNGQEENSQWNLTWLYTDTKGCLWEIGKRGRVYGYDCNHDEFKLAYDLQEADQHEGLLLTSFGYLDKDNIIWLCTPKGIYQYNTQNGESNRMTCQVKESITSIEQIDDTHYMVGTENGIHYMKRQEDGLVLSADENTGTLQMHVNDIYYHKPSEKVFIGTLQQGIFVYDLQRDELISLEDDLKDITIYRICYLNEEEILIGTDGTGVYKLNTTSYLSEPYITADYTRYNAMNGNNISDIFVDEEKRIWMANYPFGITMYDNRYPSYNWIKHSINNPQSLVNDQVNAVMEDSDGDIWYATNNGVSRYNPTNKQWYTYLSSFNNNIKNKNHTFLSLCEIRPDVMVVGGYNSGIYLIRKNENIISFHTPVSLISEKMKPDKYIRTFLKEKNGHIWAGGNYHLKEMDLDNMELRTIEGLNGITVIKEKDDEHLWIGTANGLFLLEKKSGEWKSIGLPVESNYIYSLLQMPDGRLYIGTNNSGLLVYDHQTGRFEHYHKENSALISNNIYHILSDGGERLIMSMENGLCCYNLTKRKFYNWTKEHGLMTDHFNASSGTLLKNGNFIFGSTDGAIEYSKDMVLPRNHSFRMVFSDLNIFNKPVYPGDEDSPLTKDIDETETLHLKYKHEMVSMKVSSINFDYPSLVLYTWKLEGFFNEWSKPEHERIIRFTNLSPGTYMLKVRAISSEDKREILQERELKIVVEQPFWFSPWAMLLYLLLLLAATAIYMRMDMLKRKRKLSEEKIKFFINTAHDIRTPLTLIKAPLEEMEQKEPLTEKGRESIYTALRNVNALLRLTTNLITFERTGFNNTRLVIAEFELNSYLKELLDAFRDYAATQDIGLTYRSNFDYLNAWIDQEKMESILKNLISNALKYTPKQGNVEIEASNEGRFWCVKIKDNGIGIPADEQKRLFKSHFRSSNAINSKITGSGIGLLLVWKLVKLHKGRIELESKEGEGTCVTLHFPKEAKEYKKAQRTVSQPQAAHITDSHTTQPSNIPTTHTDSTEPQVGTNEKKKKLLVVEDNDELRTYLKHSLEEYIVQTCANGIEALNIIEEYMPDLIISDIMMPEMRGDELCLKLKNDIATSHIPIMLLTALSHEQDIINGLECGADEYMAKPFSIGILRKTIAGLLANRERVYKKLASMEVFDENERIEDVKCANSLDWKFISTVRKEVEKHMSDPDFNVDKLCDLLAMSRTSFYNKLRALTEHSPGDYVRHIRLDYAKKMLHEEKYTITEISDMTGFSDVKYFREVFKKYFHISPSEYRKQINQNS